MAFGQNKDNLSQFYRICYDLWGEWMVTEEEKYQENRF